MTLGNQSLVKLPSLSDWLKRLTRVGEETVDEMAEGAETVEMSAGQKYRRTNFEEDDNVSAEDVTPTGVVYDPVVAFRAQGTFCQRRTSLERLLFCCAILLTIVIVVLIVLLGSGKTGPQRMPNIKIPDRMITPANSKTTTTKTSTDPLEKICLTKTCITVSSSILNSLEESIDPCSDFYQFACGGWIKSHPIPPGESRMDTFGALRRENQIVLKNILDSPLNESHSESELKAKVYYRSCIDANHTVDLLGASPLVDLLKSFGGWSVTNTSGLFNVTAWDFQDILERVHSYGLFNFFGVWVAEDEKNPTQNIFQIDQSGLVLQRDQYLNRSISEDKVLSAYLHFMTEIGVLLGGEQNHTREAMKKVVELEQKIANISAPMEQRRESEKLYNKGTLAQLQNISSFIDWKRYINRNLKVTSKSYQVDEKEPILIKQPDYLNQISLLVESLMTVPEGKITVHNYMMWHLIRMSTSYLSKPFQDAKKQFLHVLYGTSGDEEAWRYCVSDTEAVFGFAVGAMFVRETFQMESKRSAEQMITYVKEAFKSNLPKLEWMDEETRKAAIEKADAVMDMIGFPDFILNATQLDDRYHDLTVNEAEYFVNNLHSLKYTVKMNLDKLRLPNDKYNWNMAPSVVNAYYSPTNNQIVFPAGILQRVFFDKDYPNSLNFGAMGVVMGHELTHGFDDQGRKYDKSGVLRPWWNTNSVDKFKERTKCMVDQYSQYSAYGENIRGAQTLGENIADNGGLKSSYYAYTRWLHEHPNELLLPGLNMTHQQLFFLAFAQVWCVNSRVEDTHMSILADSHSLHKFRVIGPLSNSREFSDAFHCKAGSAMNPQQKCEVW